MKNGTGASRNVDNFVDTQSLPVQRGSAAFNQSPATDSISTR